MSTPSDRSSQDTNKLKPTARSRNATLRITITEPGNSTPISTVQRVPRSEQHKLGTRCCQGNWTSLEQDRCSTLIQRLWPPERWKSRDTSGQRGLMDHCNGSRSSLLGTGLRDLELYLSCTFGSQQPRNSFTVSNYTLNV